MKRILWTLAAGSAAAAFAAAPAFAAKAEKRPADSVVAGRPAAPRASAPWDERSARIAVRSWLEKNPQFALLPPPVREATVRKYADRLASGEEHAVELRGRLPRVKFKIPETASRADEESPPEAGRPSPPRPPGAVARPAKAEAPARSPARGGELFPYAPTRLKGEPEAHRLSVPGPPDERNVTIMSPAFPEWLDRALRQKTAEGGIPLDWKVFPDVANRYGRKVTPRMFVMAVVLIESRGVQRRGGRVFAASGYHGFMQLGREYPKAARFEGEANMIAGVRHLYPSFHKVFVQDARFRKGEPAVDRLLMAGVCYNRGNYSRASKMRWRELVARTKPVPLERRGYSGLHDNRIAVFYGLQLKGYLGFPLTADEKKWLRSFRRINDPAAWADRKYAECRNALLMRCKVGR